MNFIAFNLKDFHNQDTGHTMVGVKFIQAKNLQAAKDFITRFYPEQAWSVVPKKVFDTGIILPR